MKDKKNDDVISKLVVDESTGEERLITLHRDHPKPVTRRDFLSTGIIGFSGMMVAPSILNVLARPEFAFGQETDQCSTSGGGLPAFITVNLSGGASLSGNLPPLNEGRDPLPGYSLLGLGPDSGVMLNDTMSSTMFQGVRVAGTRNATVPAGHFWLGLANRAAQGTVDKTSLVNVCIASADDNSGNRKDVSGLIMASGLSGEILPNLGTTANTPTGIGHQAAIVTPEAPLIVRNYSDIAGSLRPAGTLATRLTDARRKKLLELVGSLSGSQARTVASPGSATGITLARVVECATGKNVELAATTDPGIDPGLEPSVASIWGINPNNKTGTAYAQAAMIYNSLKGNASTSGINLGGYDYHGNARATTNQRDREAGELVGRILETAAVMNKAVMIYVTSDGSVSAPGGSAFGDRYTNDSGTRGMDYILAFHPNSRPQVKNDPFKHQIGFYTSGQGASDQSVVGSVEKAAAAVLANYLSFANQMVRFDTVASGVFQRGDMDEVVRILPAS
ncbi:MAG: hypothetical protein RBT63_04225 [Bdellovibrionales bacterium]|nr:hypothetical protein [Bdellovibrionales bacterium]